jgi:hypothetical protein
MSGKVSGMIWDLDLPHAEAWVLMAMADHADHEGNNVYPSVGLIAWKTCYSERQVQRIIKSLRTKRILVPMEEAAGHVVKYRIVLTGVPLKAPREKANPRQNVTPDKMSPLTPSRKRGDIAMSEGGDTQMSPEPSLNRQRNGGVETPSQTTPPPVIASQVVQALLNIGLTENQTRLTLAQRDITMEEVERIKVWLKGCTAHKPMGVLWMRLKVGMLPDDLPPPPRQKLPDIEWEELPNGTVRPKNPADYARIYGSSVSTPGGR